MLTSYLANIPTMSSQNDSPTSKDGMCWTEKESLGLNIVVKEEKEEEDVTVKKEVEIEAVTVKEEELEVKLTEDEDAFRVEEEVTVKEEEKEEVGEMTVTVKEEEDIFGMKEVGEITVTLEEEEEEETGDLINRERPDSQSESRKSPSGEPDPETPNPAMRHHCSQCNMSFKWLWKLKEHERNTQEKSPSNAPSVEINSHEHMT
nr:cilia- and flagella-associated protein 251-like isoform X2 [Salvelinus alpinus]